MKRTALVLAAAAALGLWATPAAADADLWLSDRAARREAQAQIEQLDRDLQGHHSATAVLQRWCDAHGPGTGVRIVARRAPGAEKPADARVRRKLKAAAGEPIRYRRVQLSCGGQVLSDADNWYRPGRLTPEMNRLLDETETPFGVVVAPLRFTRGTRSSRRLFAPGRGRGPVTSPYEILRQSAVLSAADGAPISLVVETYTREILRRRGGGAP
ncbi:hypothetical protein [Phenylobacterium sp.]|uniref:hypothetical protein n=1 Tax=Phenylobacterium sp. TaxID=1871053 RepID=UPI00378358B3